jgi:CRP-like cAMP-binding protein
MALVSDAPRSASVRAQGDVAVLELGRELFDRLLDSDHDFALRFQEELAICAVRQHRRILKRLDDIFRLGENAASPSAGNPNRNASLEDELDATLGDHAAGLRELSISPDELDAISVVTPEGQVTAAEVRIRLGR